jgi:hypothetical protein
MIGELDLYGVFVPALLVVVAVALPLTAVLRRLLRLFGFYRLVWHRPLFDLALLVIVMGGLVAVTAGEVSP